MEQCYKEMSWCRAAETVWQHKPEHNSNLQLTNNGFECCHWKCINLSNALNKENFILPTSNKSCAEMRTLYEYVSSSSSSTNWSGLADHNRTYSKMEETIQHASKEAILQSRLEF